MSAVTKYPGWLQFVAKAYSKNVGSCLAAYGLRYEDLLIESPEVLAATDRIPKHELDARTQRWATAQYLDAKKAPLKGSNKMQAQEKAFQTVLEPHIEFAQKESRERLDWK